MAYKQEELDQVKKLWNTDTTLATMAFSIGCSLDKIRKIAKTLNLPKRTRRDKYYTHTKDIAKVVTQYGADALAEVKNNQCLFPIGKPEIKGFKFCGKEKIKDKPYCLNCCKKAYVNFGEKND